MKIETTYNYGDTVYYMKFNKVKTGVISELRIMYTYSGYSGAWNERAYPLREEYAFEKNDKTNDWIYIHVSQIFPSKELLLASL